MPAGPPPIAGPPMEVAGGERGGGPLAGGSRGDGGPGGPAGPPSLGGGGGEAEGEGEGEAGRARGPGDPGDGPPDLPALRDRVHAAISRYWAARAAFEAIPKATWILDSAGDVGASLVIDRAHQAKNRATAGLIACIRGHADAMDAAESCGSIGGAGRATGSARPGRRPSDWPMYPDERDGRLYFAGEGPGGACGDDGVAVVRLSGWACEAVGKMAGGSAGKGSRGGEGGVA